MVVEEDLAAIFGGWNKVNKKTRETLCKNARKVSFAAGEVLLKKDGIAFFIVKKGGVNVFSGSENGDEFFLYHIFKEEGCSVIEELTYVFPSPTELFVIDKQAYEAAEQSATVSAFFLRTERRQEEKMLSQINMVMFTSVEKRLADLLLTVSARTKGRAVTYTHEQIAKFIGTSREVVTRKLKALEEEGLVTLARGRVIIGNREELKKKK